MATFHSVGAWGTRVQDLRSAAKMTERATCAVERKPCIHAAHTHGMAHSSGPMRNNRSAAGSTPRACHVQCVWTCKGDFSGISSTFHSVEAWGTRVQDLQTAAKTAETKTCAVEKGPCIHAAHTYSTRHSSSHDMCSHRGAAGSTPRAGHVQCVWTCKGDFGGISSTFIA